MADGLALQDLYEDTRIPNIVVAADGTVLAFAGSGRYLRRSEDRGQTWSEAQDLGEEARGSAVVDTVTGQVLLVDSSHRRLWRSADHGVTWTVEDITIAPNGYGHGVPETVPIVTPCSESGVTLRFGQHAGRLLMPGRIQPPHGDNGQEWWAYNYNTSLYSDDRGTTWQVSDPIMSGTGEGTLAEIADGRVYYNSRCHMAVDHRRRICWSHDGGHRWVDWQVSEHLYEIGQPFYFKYGSKPSYGCNAGLVRVPDAAAAGHDDVLLFSTPGTPGGDRTKMTVWASTDGAVTWPHKRLVYEGMSAYSSITADDGGRVYLLFERGEEKLYDRMAVAVFELEWLLPA